MRLIPDLKKLDAYAENALKHHCELVYHLKAMVARVKKAGVPPFDSDVVQAERVLAKVEKL